MYERVFVYYTRGMRTGGPEALHQLVDALRRLGQDAFLVPLAYTRKSDRVSAYDHYDAPEVLDPEVGARDCVVVPETILGPLRSAHAGTSMIWWLSIDNSPIFRADRSRASRTAGWRSDGRAQTMGQSARDLIERVRSVSHVRRSHHLAQSTYAWTFLYSRMNVLASSLSDYTPQVEADGGPQRSSGLTVSYNPAKGGEHVSSLRARMHEAIEWLPIESMGPDEVQAALKRSDIYLDLGHHPGKDRLPREAALAGAVTVVARRGAGAFWADTPLPEAHKVSPGPNMVNDAAETIREILADLPSHRALQEPYRQQVGSEQDRFMWEVENVFIRGVRQIDPSSIALRFGSDEWPGRRLA